MYQLITDSGCDLPFQTLQAHHVAFVSMHFNLDGQEITDDLGQSYDINDCFEKIAAGVMPTTTQVNVGEFLNCFTPYVEAKTPILYLGFSSGLSGTYNSAVQARAMLLEDHPDAEIYVVDSRAASAGLGLMVLDAVAKQAAGMPVAELAQWLTEQRNYYHQWFTVDDLNYLYHGGRLSRTSAALGTLLKIKPVMNVDEPGHLAVVGKVRSRAKSLQALADHILTAMGDQQATTIIIAHSHDQAAAEVVQAKLAAAAPAATIKLLQIGLTISSHTGIGCVAVFVHGTIER